jgi:hypothetical protein
MRWRSAKKLLRRSCAIGRDTAAVLRVRPYQVVKFIGEEGWTATQAAHCGRTMAMAAARDPDALARRLRCHP